MKKLLTPIKVGVLTIVAVVGTVYALRTVEEGSLGGGNTYRVYAVLENALGIAKRSRVMMAGIEIGYIESIELSGARARLNLRIRKSVLLYQDAMLAKISESILGDKLIEITPGTDQAHPLVDGDEIKDTYVEKGFSELMRDLPGITQDIRKLTSQLTKTVEQINQDDSVGHVMRRLTEIADTVAQLSTRANDIIGRNEARIDQIIGDVASITGDTRAQYKEILQNIHDASAEIKKLFGDLNAIVGGDETDLKKNAGEIKGILAKANRSMEQLESITRKIDQGQGTLGRLVNDDKIATKTEGILDDASSLTSRLARLQLYIDLRSEFLVRQNSAKSYLGLKLLPSSDMYYMVELIDDPRGSANVIQMCDSPTGDLCDHKTSRIKIERKFKYSVEIAKRFYFVSLRIGVIENSGGVGMNWHFFGDDLEFRFDLFQFGTNEYNVSSKPRLKAMVVYRPSWLANHIYITAGGDDPFNQTSSGRSLFDYFFGAGFSFNDQDLKALFTVTGIPK
jgi:phospholipid/cholesterol/gamma-HCH transport system substrate-binding protein